MLYIDFVFLATVPPPLSYDERRPQFYRSLSIMVPTACAVVVLVVILIVACVVVKKRRHVDNPNRRGTIIFILELYKSVFPMKY